MTSLPRRTLVLSAVLSATSAATATAQEAPLLHRIAAATIGAVDAAGLAALYEKHFGYRTVAQSSVDAALAASWGAPASAGRRAIILQPAGGEATFIRLVEIDPVADFRAITTLGWNSIELAAIDPDAVHDDLKKSAFRVIGAPAQLAAFPAVRAMQAIGPAEEVVHITSETGPSVFVPPTSTPVGRVFIMVLATSDVAATTDWYAARFRLKKNTIRRGPIATINGAQKLADDHRHAATFLAAAEHASFLELWEFDGAANRPRPRARGQLPPGVAMASFTVANLDALALDWIAPPAPRPSPIYNGRRSATFVGPAGELVELIEGE